MHSGRLLLLVTVLATALLAGCQSVVGRRTEQLFPGFAGPQLEALIDYGNRLRDLSSTDLKSEYTGLNGALGEESEPEEIIRLALVLSMPQTPFHDDSRALELLEGVGGSAAEADGDAPAALRQFARFCAHLISEHQRQMEQARRELRVTQVRLESSQAEALALRRKLQALQQLEEELQQRVVE